MGRVLAAPIKVLLRRVFFLCPADAWRLFNMSASLVACPPVEQGGTGRVSASVPGLNTLENLDYDKLQDKDSLVDG